MPNHVVLGANVLAHSANPGDPHFESALAAIVAMLEANVDTLLALDDTGKNAPALETSHLYQEYSECVAPGSLAREMLRVLGEAGRIAFYRRPGQAEWRKCKRLVPRNNGDAIVLGVGAASLTKLVVSNDYADFSPGVRREAESCCP